MNIRFSYHTIILMITTPLLILVFSCIRHESKYDKARAKMVEQQIEDRGIIDKNVINAMKMVKRHKFIPQDLIDKAYGDYPLSIGFEQTISQPYIVALTTQLLGLDKESRVLEIGTGSGYQTAVIALICKEVYTIEIVNVLSQKAQGILNSEGYGNIHFKVGDGYLGWEENAPFDAIIVTCAPENIPPALKEQLAEGGRMIIPVGGRNYVQKLVLIEKTNGILSEKMVETVRFLPMVDQDGNTY